MKTVEGPIHIDGDVASSAIDMTGNKKPAMRLLAAIDNEPWLITEGALDQIKLIAAREHDYTALSKYAGANQGSDLVTIMGSTAVLNIRGPMARYADIFSDVSGMTSTEKLAAAYSTLDSSDDIGRIILQIDSPGGTVNGISEFAELIAAGDTPTIAYITGQGSSAAYWVASQADTIYVSRTAITGSIGVRTEAPDKPSDKIIVSKYAPAKIGSAAATSAVVDRLEVEFHEAIAEGRGVSADHVREHFGQGGVFVGGDAVDAGLADYVATLDQILAGSVGMPPVRRTTTTSATGETMTEKTTGGIATAEHEQAVADARQEGYDAGLAAGQKESADQTRIDERARIAAIAEAGAGKPAEQVKMLIENGADVETAKSWLAASPDVKPASSIDPGKNPELTGDAPVPTDDDEPDNTALWDEAREEEFGDAA